MEEAQSAALAAEAPGLLKSDRIGSRESGDRGIPLTLGPPVFLISDFIDVS